MRWLSPPDKRAGGAGERQVVEADIDQELQALADLLQDALGDLVLLRGQRRRQARRTRPWALRIEKSVTSAMSSRSSFTASASGFRR